ncbi:endonuclease/exonuclease/phosphatase family protein [Octadecabacter sp. CECT 8868]|uniref:endonuclease/exonuclease/phosphatase family protein n=1 Tax=Octadecabacter algicola TaxID=2909342 RepID=UPI001F179027|nr:endonuclease/exonuclease/phosphatase family protein [Octadecabacter algicola]MCF2905874.1 endonuclease/exonuclease/phosphatase family protein [Octadecabacter algicola]
MLRDLIRGEDPEIDAISTVIDQVSPDVLLLTDFDYDAGDAALAAFSAQLDSPFPYLFSAQPNAGVHTGLDMDGDGRTGDARDALGYGRFLGDGGMAILSRYEISKDDIRNLTELLWKDVPGATLPTLDGEPFPSQQVHDMIPVSSTGHWIVPVLVGPQRVSLLAFAATAPVFDGPEDFNGLRNRDELRVWEAVLDGQIGATPERPILIGNVNAEPFDGEGFRDGIAGVLARSDLQDPQPASEGGADAMNVGHQGNPAFDTADWSEDGPGNLRVSYVLPSSDLSVVGAGVFWPALDDPLASLLGSDGLAAGPHHLVWVDIRIESP